MKLALLNRKEKGKKIFSKLIKIIAFKNLENSNVNKLECLKKKSLKKKEEERKLSLYHLPKTGQ